MYLLRVFVLSMRLGLNILHSNHVRNVRLGSSSWPLDARWPRCLLCQWSANLILILSLSLRSDYLIRSLFLTTSLHVVLTWVGHVPLTLLRNEARRRCNREDEADEQVCRRENEDNGLRGRCRLACQHLLFTWPHVRNAPSSIVIAEDRRVQMKL